MAVTVSVGGAGPAGKVAAKRKGRRAPRRGGLCAPSRELGSEECGRAPAAGVSEGGTGFGRLLVMEAQQEGRGSRTTVSPARGWSARTGPAGT